MSVKFNILEEDIQLAIALQSHRIAHLQCYVKFISLHCQEPHQPVHRFESHDYVRIPDHLERVHAAWSWSLREEALSDLKQKVQKRSERHNHRSGQG